ncbi:mechanosensitive ion channel [Aerophototrophica crusticola]|uniref:Mechanosensitive ion channel n=1 Tax=Aerophototrophica crusticola TaxID=1709002 RepID=A0A858R9T8_9PROT|nr:mechanosensitive ion channel [Rhodospirillaceae bacterium B3]
MSRVRRLCLPALSLILLLLGTLPSPAQVPVPAPSKPAPAAEVDPKQIDSLVHTLEDEGQRAALVKQLKTLSEAQKAADDTPPETFGTRILTTLSDRAEDVSAEISAAGRALVDTPRALRWLNQQVQDPAKRATWARLFLELVVVVAAGYVARFLMLWLLARPRRALSARPANGVWSRLPLLFVRVLMDLLPAVAFVAAGYGVLAVTNPPKVVSQAALAFISASIVVQLVMIAARVPLSPSGPNLRLLKVSDETAHYLVIWVRRIAFTAVYGYFIAQAALFLGLPSRPYAALLKLVGLVVAAMLVVLVLQNRHAFADWLRGTRRLEPGTQDPADVALAAAVAGESTGDHPPVSVTATTGAKREPRQAWNAARRRLAEVWHVLAILYIVVIYGIWALDIEGGFEYVLRATLVTLVALVVGRLVSRGVDRLVARGFRVAPDLKSQYPRLEQRANRYLPILNRVLKGFVSFVVAMVVLEAWGIDSLGWLATPVGQRVSGSLVSITFIIVFALVAWEVVSGAIERYLTATDTSGQVVQRSARVRTLLPLLRNAFMVLLLTIVILTTLSELGLDIAPLLAGAGVVGLAIGFGAQTLVKDVITGLFILFEDTISIGDVVNLGALGGVVEGITIRTIRLRDYNGAVHTVPFSSVTTVSNLTKDFSFAVLNVTVDYREDTDRVVQVLGEIAEGMRQDPKYAPLILAPLDVAGVDAFQDSAVLVKARIKTRPIQQWTVGREFNRRMKKRFDELGINIPFPQRTVHIAGGLPEKADPKTLALAAAQGAVD